MGRSLGVAAAIVISLLAVSGAGGTAPQTPQKGGTVVVSYSSAEPPCLNSWLPACQNGSGGVLIDQALQGALEPGPHGWRDVLVSRTTLTKKPFTVTYHIRPQAHWSDGKPVTARDFVFSYRMALKYDHDPDNALRTDVRHFVAVDAKTLRVDFGSYDVYWHSLLPRPLPRHVLVSEDFSSVWNDAIDDPKTGKPIGDGPFLVEHWQRGRQLVLVRNSQYWGPHPAHIARLVFRFVSDPSEVLQNGEVDLLGGTQDQGAAFALAQQPPAGIKVLSAPGPTEEHLDIRVAPPGNPALRSKLVRRALAYGIDREALVRELSADIAANLPIADNTVYLPNEPEYQPNWNVYRYRPTLARRLLRQAGCRLGTDAIFVCAGQKLSLRFLTSAGNERRAQTLQIVQAQLRRLGVEVVPVFAPGSAIFPPPDGILWKGDFDVALFGWDRDPASVSWEYGCGYPTNHTGYCSRLVTSDTDQLFEIVDPGQRAKVANLVDRRLVKDVPTIPLFQPPLFVAFRNTIHGVVPSAFNDPTWNAEDWWVER